MEITNRVPRRILAATTLLDMAPVIAADRIAKETDAWLDVCHVVADPQPAEDPLFPELSDLPLSLATRKEMARSLADQKVTEITGRSMEQFRLHILSGDPGQRILSASVGLDADLIVVAAGSGRSWRHWKGVIHTLLEDGRTPVLVTRPGERHEQILAATDLMSGNFPVLAEGLRMAAVEHAHLTAVNVVPIIPATYAGLALSDFDPGVRALADQSRARVMQACSDLGADEGEVEVCIESGTPALEIARLARETLADLVVVGSRAHFRKSWFLGSVGEAVVELAPCSVLVVPLERQAA